MMTIKKAIVTGATGMIGSALIEHLVKEGIEVLAICRRESKRINNIPSNSLIKKVYCDLNEYNSIIIDDQYDAFFHLAWKGTSGEERNDINMQIDNIKFTMDAINLAIRARCKIFIGSGSQAEYGRSDKDLSSETKVDPETGYGIAKYCSGKLGKIYAESKGIKFIWVRILSVYGPGDRENSMIMYIINSLLNKKVPKLTSGDQIWDYIYKDDAARALFYLAVNGKDGKTYCLGSGENRKLKEFVFDIRDNIDSNLKLGFGEVPYGENQVMSLRTSIEELTKDTGFVPEISFEEGIRKTINYCRNNR